MRLLRDTSISRKLMVVILVTTSAALLVASAAFVAYDLVAFRQSMAADLSTLAKVVGTNSNAALAFNDHEAANEVLSALTAKQNIVRARIYTARLEMFAEYLREGAPGGDIEFAPKQVSTTALTDNYLIASQTIDLDGETIGTVYLVSNLDAQRSRLNRYAGLVAAVLFGSLLVAFLLSSRFKGLISDPISHLAKTARAVSINKDYSIRAVKNGRDEMGMLIDCFNEMLSEIQERDAKLQAARDELEHRVEARTKELQDEISERRRIEDVLRNSEEYFRSLIENASDIIAIVDLDATIRYASPSVERVLGYKPEDMIGREVSAFTHPEDVTATSLLQSRASETGTCIESVEVRFKHNNGEWRTLDVFGKLVRDGSGTPQIIINTRDITERKQAEETLREREALFRSLAESVSAAIYIYRDSKYIYLNPAAEVISGYSCDELMNMEVWDIVEPEFRAQLATQAAHRLQGQSVPPRSEIRIRTKNGEARWLDLTATLIQFQGTPAVLATAFDITERKGWEQTLRESEEKYRTILQSIQEGYYEVDLAGCLTFFNDSLSRIVGTPAEKMHGLSHHQYTDAQTAASLAETFGTVYRTGKPVEGLQYEITTLEGVRRFVETSVSLRRLPNGTIAGFRGTIRDVTERRRSEEALRESQERYRILFESAPDSILIFEGEGADQGHIIAANQAAAEISGYTVDELLKLTIEDLQPVDQTAVTSGGRQHIVDGRLLTAELLRLRKDGTTFPIEVNASPLTLDGKRYILSFGRDITQRKRTEKEVAMLAHAMQSIHEFIVVLDLAGNIIFVNEAVVKGFGYNREELIGKHITLLHSQGAAPELVEHILSEAKGEGWDGEMLSRRKDGTEFPIYLSASEIRDESGRPVAFVGVSQDITERRRTIEELQNAKEAAESANRAKSEFLANMSHEIRTPMNGIMGMTELALDTDLTVEQREYLKLVKLSSDSLLGVINDILDFSKIEAGKLELDLDEFNLQDAIDDVMKALGVRAEQKGLELAYYLRPGVPDLIIGDVGRLRQILVNLVGNAIKFTDRGEVIVRVELESQTDDEITLHFGIRDTGIGIPAAKQKMIFESFTQADGSTTRKYGGTGLGLAISSQLAGMMNGSIWVESPVELPGRREKLGSIFHVTAKFRVARHSADIAPPLQAAFAGRPVLVVDDNATNRRILEVQLTNWNMNAVAADGATSALEAIAQAADSGFPFRLMLLDFHMPDVDGLTLAKQIKELPGSDDIRIIMMSSSVLQNQSNQKLCGIDASLVKPVKAAELLGVIKTVLGAQMPAAAQPRPTGLSTANPSRILVAEDSPVNQALIKRLLEKWGHTPFIAADGAESLAQLERGQFELILMDLQMPELNGFEATAAIRRQEQGTNKHIPIIALTAHALKGDRERCIDAGMDDYISKPIEPKLLFEAIERAVTTTAAASADDDEHHRGVLNFDSLLNTFDGDRELLLMLGKIFVDISAQQLAILVEAIKRGDAEALARDAHLLRGAVSNFRAEAAFEAAVRLEEIARSGDLSLANAALARLESEIGRVVKDFQMLEQASLS